MSESDLKRELVAVVEAGFGKPPDGVPIELARAALEALGSPDSVLRDELAYRVLAQWIYEGLLSTEEVRELLLRAASTEMLFAGIGERQTHSVFRRAFSLLVIAVALDRDTREPFLSEREWRRILDSIVSYCEREQDLRAHVDKKGWAHAIAHAADVVDELARSRFASKADARRLFDALRMLVDRADEVFQGEEDERLAIALASLLTSGNVEPAEFHAWFHAAAPAAPPTPDFAAQVRRVNWKLVARSLLLRLQREQSPTADEFSDLDRPFSIY
jgi:hypothetical protein